MSFVPSDRRLFYALRFNAEGAVLGTQDVILRQKRVVDLLILLFGELEGLGGMHMDIGVRLMLPADDARDGDAVRPDPLKAVQKLCIEGALYEIALAAREPAEMARLQYFTELGQRGGGRLYPHGGLQVVFLIGGYGAIDHIPFGFDHDVQIPLGIF